MKQTYKVLGMTCSGCQSKINNALNAIEGVEASVDLEQQTATLISNKSLNLESLNQVLKEVGNYQLQDSSQPQNSTFIPPQDRVSPSSVYYCPMECEGDKVYFKQGERCPVCQMYLVPIEEKKEHQHKHQHQPTINSQKPDMQKNAGKYYCPMFCEGDKVYDTNVGCPICGMDLVKIPDGNSEDTTDTHYQTLKQKLWVALGFTIPLFIISMGGMWVDFGWSHQTQGIIELLLTLPVLFYAGWFLMVRGWRSYTSGHLNMFSLIALGVVAAFGFSLISLFFPQVLPEQFHQHPPLYFEAVGVILTLVILGQLMEAQAHKKTGEAIKQLMNLSPSEAFLIEDNQERIILLSEVKIGDVLLVKPGGKIPVDGKIIDGNATIDESMITGEPIPIEKSKGDMVISGTINGNQAFKMKAEKVGSDTLLSQIINMVNDASRSKAPIQKLADKVAKVFVPTVIGIAVLTFILWYLFGGENRLIMALINAVAVLIVACPCALGLATPMSLMVGIGKGAQHGILIKDAQALEMMDKVEVLITDKTGTLTEGKPSLESIKSLDSISKDLVLEIATSLAQNSEHPLSKALVNAYKKPNSKTLDIEQFENIPGKGVKGKYSQSPVFMGNRALIDAYQLNLDETLAQDTKTLQQKGHTVSYIAQDHQVIGLVSFTDKIKSNAKAAIEKIQAQGIEVIMMTGDNETTAQAIASQLGIKDYQAACLPQDKMQRVKTFQAEGKIVAMTGDGINDAPALAQSNVGIAMGTGTDIAMESAEITLLKGDLMGVANARVLSEKVLKNIKENLFFAFVYNTLGIPIAAGLLYPIFGLLLSPMLAAVAMSFSSVSVILNALRLRRMRF
ncbi:heavy metal translocating P-type ATPase [Riemerella columbina]|uniref:heavy metal translocating P-type ATPase n=1 Tax=Riemerella columbina TaxID=103810 RepID=UPI000382EC57|nr:heavy metal translocating P-type ATPase [Riemerella columbina]